MVAVLMGGGGGWRGVLCHGDPLCDCTFTMTSTARQYYM